MAVHKIRKGLDLPILGEPEQTIETASPPTHVALLGADYPGMKPSLMVREGDQVRRGQALFEDKKTPGVMFTAPAGGKVVGIHRGAKRVFQSLVIELDQDERAGKGETMRFAASSQRHPTQLDAADVQALLVESGLWTALRTRPYNRVADPATRPHSIFVTAMDSSPLAPDTATVLAGRGDDFERGLTALSKLTAGTVYICTAPETDLQLPADGQYQVEYFDGPHPAGTVGFHIHTLDPVNRAKLVWHVGYQDVVAIGRLFRDGHLDVERVVSLAGPSVRRPRLLRTRVGAAVDSLVKGEVERDDGEVRLVSGSVLSGRKAEGLELAFLGRYHQQVSVLPEGREREFLGWLMPGGDKFSVLRAFTSAMSPSKKFDMTTSTQGSDRAIVPIGAYEKVFPFDMMPSYLMKSLVMGDIEQAEALGALELAEEDVALCTFVCSSKHDFGVHLRDVLTIIEKEG